MQCHQIGSSLSIMGPQVLPAQGIVNTFSSLYIPTIGRDVARIQTRRHLLAVVDDGD